MAETNTEICAEDDGNKLDINERNKSEIIKLKGRRCARSNFAEEYARRIVEELKRRERKYNSCKGKQGLQFTLTTCINDSFPCEFVVEMLHTDVSFNLFAR